MKKNHWSILLLFIMNWLMVSGQEKKIDRHSFFTDDRPVEATLVSDFWKLLSDKQKYASQSAFITLQFPDGNIISDSISIAPRGEFRRNNCRLPSLLLHFNIPATSKLKSLKKLKLVLGCNFGTIYEQLVLKEYLTYKIYNLLTDFSFRVRLLKINYRDSRKKIKPFTQYAFLIEDVDDMAARNNCHELKAGTILTENTNRNQMTLVALFQYMIGNTDWAVPKNHNTKLLLQKKDTTGVPYVVAYDFDFAGLIGAPYAIPSAELNIQSVAERVYMGFARTAIEIELALGVFKNQKDSIYSLINNFLPLSQKQKSTMTRYLGEFYSIINDKAQVEYTFVNNTRTN